MAGDMSDEPKDGLKESLEQIRKRLLERAERKRAKQDEEYVREQLRAEGLFPVERRLFFRDDAKAQKSFIEARGPVGGVQLKIISSMCPQARRALGVSLIRSMKPILKYLRTFEIRHEGELLSLPRLEERGLPLSRSPDLDTEPGRMGFEIRMKRLKIGWTQQELAVRASMDFRHLSRIERGIVKARPKALDKIRRALNSILETEDATEE